MRSEGNRHPPRLSRAHWQSLLDRMYPVPDPLSSDEERARFCHEDLGGLGWAELKLERDRLTGRLTFDDTPHRWLWERLDAIDLRMGHVA